MTTPNTMRRILAIDGGGIKGVFPASFLAAVEHTTGRPIGECFDLVVGTSTGGIIALGLGMGLSAMEIMQFYETLGPGMFANGAVANLVASFRQWFAGKYGN